MNELSPRLSIDPALGQWVADCSIDDDALVTYMQGRGISDTDIANTTLRISTERTESTYKSVKKQSRTTVTTIGRFDPQTATLSVYPMSRIEAANAVIEKEHTAGKFLPEDTVTFYSRVMSARLNEVLRHEIEHQALKADTQLQAQSRKYEMRTRAKIVSPVAGVMAASGGFLYADEALGSPIPGIFIAAGYLGGLAMAYRYISKSELLYQAYLSRPEEIRCRSVETADDTSLISFRLKQPEA